MPNCWLPIGSHGQQRDRESPPMNSLLSSIEIVRPEAIEFGPDTIAALAHFAEVRRLRRTLVVTVSVVRFLGQLRG